MPRYPAAIGAGVLAALSWLVLVGAALWPRTSTAGAQGGIWWCMPGMGVGAASASSLSATLAAMPMCSTMVLAMTLPATIPAVEHVALNSLRRRERRAVVEFVAVYLGLWLGFGLGLMLILAALDLRPSLAVLAGSLALAAVWDLTPAKARALNRCHRSTPLPPRGVRASLGTTRFGWVNGSACVGACWPMMLAMLAAPVARLEWTLGLTALAGYQKLTRRPRRALRRSAAILAASAGGTALALLIG
jgi:predicted metal-binding membrane protein